MRWSNSFIPTLRENPADAEYPSHQLLVRGGFVRQAPAGVLSFLPLGRRVMLKIAAVIREEMNRNDAQEFFLPLCGPADRRFLEIARGEIRSYRELPQIWYQIQARSEDQVRPGSSLLNLRQFTAMDCCSFDADREGMDKTCQVLREACRRMFARCGLEPAVVETDSGAMEAGRAQKFIVRTEAGDDPAAYCACGYAATLDSAVSSLPGIEDPPSSGGPREVHTPDRKTIADITAYLGVPPTHQIKSLVYICGENPYLFLVRGDHQLSEAKVRRAVRKSNVRPALPEEISDVFGAEAGSLGPAGVDSVPVHADLALRGRSNLTCGANRNDYHLQGVTPEVHFKPIWADLRTVESGEGCARCGKALEICKAVTLAHISQPGTEGSEALGALILTPDGRQTPLVVADFGIILERILSMCVELHHDHDGILWPPSIAPFSVIITPINYRDEVRDAADRLYAGLSAAGVDVLLDDRMERPGVKFKDADLIGIPYRVVVGAENLKQGKVELFVRSLKMKSLLDLDSLVPALSQKLTS